MAINKKLILFLKLSDFNTLLSAGNILDTSIVFIKDVKLIYTLGQIFPCPYTLDELAALFAKKADLTKLDDYLTKTVAASTYQPKGNYLTSLPTANGDTAGIVKGGGDVTITSGVITVNDDSHNHVISNVDGLQSALDGKVPTSRTINGQALSSNISLTAANVGADASGSASQALASAKSYTDTKISELINGAPETLDTLDEIAAALKDNAGIVDTLNSAIGGKVDKVSGKGLSTNDYTTTEKNKLAGIAAGAEVNQNAFSNVKVGETTISADSKTDTLTIAAGSNITITPDATNDTITIVAKDTTYGAASSSASGLMSKEDKIKLDAITASADSVSFSQSLTSGTKVGTININGTDTALYAPTNTNTTYSFASGTNGFTVTPSGGSALTVTVTPSIASNVTYSGTLTSGQVAIYDGTAGKIKASGYTIAASVPEGAKFTDTTYSTMTAATSSAAGKSGLVPAPAAGNQGLFLRGDGTWATPTNTTYSAMSQDEANTGTATTARSITAAVLSTTIASKIAGKLDSSTASSTYATKDELSTGLAGKVNVATGKGLSTNDYTTTEKNKLAGIASGAEVNLNAFANISDGTTTIAADAKQDTLTVAAGSGVALALDATNDKLTISHSDTSTLNGAYGPTANVTGSNGNTISVPQITVDGFGHVTGVTNRTYTSKDTTYSAISADELNTGTATTSRTVTAAVLAPWVKGQIDSKIAAADAMIYKGTIGSSGATITALPDTTAKTGWTYKVITAGTYASQACEIGDMIICLTDGSSSTAATWTVVQSNTDGHVTGPSTSTSGNVALFDGTTGKLIKDSNFTIGKSVPSNAVFTDTKYSAGTGLSASGTTFNHSNSVTAKTAYGSTATTASSNGGTITVTDIKYDAQGHITGSTDRTITLSEPHKGTVTSVNLKQGTGITVSSSGTAITSNGERTISLNAAKTDTIGGIKIHKDNSSYAITANTSPTITADQSGGKYYAVEIDKNDKAYVYVPWSNTTYSFSNSNPTLSWGTKSTIGTVGGTELTVTMPSNPNNHYTTGINAGASGATSNTEFTNPYVTVKDNSTYRSQIRLVGSGATTVKSDASGNITISSTDTDRSVTAVGYHYAPAEDTNAAISASGGSATNITGTAGKLNVVTGLKRDAKGHIVGVTSANIYSTDNNTNTTYSAGNGLTLSGTTFNVGAGTGISVAADTVSTESALYDTKSATTAATAGWYRIAASGAGISNCNGIFLIIGAVSGRHTSAIVAAGTSYGVADSSSISVLHCDQYSTSALSKVRIVYHTTYNSNYAYLEVYNPSATALPITVKMLGGTGWSLVTPSTAGSVPSGYSNKEVSLLNGILGGHKHSVSGTTGGTTLGGTVGSKTAGGTNSNTKAGGTVENATATGSVSSSFTGTAHNHTFTGTKHKHTFTGSAVTSGGPSGTTSVNSITSVGSLPSLTASYSSGKLSISLSAGSLPGYSAVSVASSGHTHSVTAAGTLDEVAAAGTIANTTAGGSVSSSFTGTAHSHTFTSTYHTHTFTGTAHDHSFTGSNHTHTYSATTGTATY